jgi:hypothetical protein
MKGIQLISKNSGEAFEIISNDYEKAIGFQKRTIGKKAVAIVDISETQVYVELVKNKTPYELSHTPTTGRIWIEKIDNINVNNLEQIYEALAPLAY